MSRPRARASSMISTARRSSPFFVLRGSRCETWRRTPARSAVRTAERAGVRLQVSHLLPRSTKNGEDLRAVEIIDEARARGLDIAFDQHTRLFGTTYLHTILPPRPYHGGKA